LHLLCKARESYRKESILQLELRFPRSLYPYHWNANAQQSLGAPSALAHDTRHKPVSYFVQLMVGSGKPSASHTRVTDWPRLAVAFTMLCLAWTVGGTEEKNGVRVVVKTWKNPMAWRRHFRDPQFGASPPGSQESPAATALV
jgi:hypothetical protein